MAYSQPFRFHTDEAILGNIVMESKNVDLAEVASDAGNNETSYFLWRSKMWFLVRTVVGVDQQLADGSFNKTLIFNRLNLQCETFANFLDLIRACSFTPSFIKRSPMEGDLFESMEQLVSKTQYKLRRIDEIMESVLSTLTNSFFIDFQKASRERIAESEQIAARERTAAAKKSAAAEKSA